MRGGDHQDQLARVICDEMNVHVRLEIIYKNGMKEYYPDVIQNYLCQ